MRDPAGEKTGSERMRVTASSRKGRVKIAEILAAATAVLVDKGYTQFSLRNIAATAGIHLSNLQYYFPTKEAIIHALMDFVVQQYDAKYQERFRTLPTMPYPRLVAILDYLIEDIEDPKTRRFFIQFWALLESTDSSGNGKLLNELYAAHIENIASYVAELNPSLSPGARRQRAAMIAAMIEGMMLMLRDADDYLQSGESDIRIEMRKQLLRIVVDPA